MTLSPGRFIDSYLGFSMIISSAAGLRGL